MAERPSIAGIRKVRVGRSSGMVDLTPSPGMDDWTGIFSPDSAAKPSRPMPKPHVDSKADSTRWATMGRMAYYKEQNRRAGKR